MSSVEIPIGYQAAIETAAYFPRHRAGYIEVHGEDRVDFLQRQTTNDLGLLSSTRSLNNVLTSATARVLETFHMLDQGEHLVLLVPPDRTKSCHQFLQSHIFFMDKVELRNASEAWLQIELHGPQASERLEEWGFDKLPEQDDVARGEIHGSPVQVIGIEGLGSEKAFLVLANKGDEATLLSALEAAGMPELDAEDRHILRVEAGLPAIGHELTPDYTPLEGGLADWVSDVKGCYTGQEVIARQLTYDKVTKGLVQLRLEQPVEQTDKVLVDGKTAGHVTSIAVSPRIGPIALAILKRPHNVAGVLVLVNNDGRQVPGKVVMPSKQAVQA